MFSFNAHKLRLNSPACFMKSGWILVMVFGLWSCSTATDPTARRQHIFELAEERGWQQNVITGENFDLATFSPRQIAPQQQLVVYIEGDGWAIYRNQPSVDPTPLRALALQLALQHPDNNAVYLGRPCQYVTAEHRHHCEPSVWTSARFSEQVIEATNHAINVLKERYHAKSLRLVGYSGGAAVAALVAARREDVVQIITVAGNLDHRSWTTWHHVTPLSASLNPTDVRRELSVIPQYHLVGEEDKVVPPMLIEKFVSGFNASKIITVKEIPDFNHHCCWVQHWESLIAL